MFTESSRWYDHIYAHLDYAGHVAALRDLIGEPTGRRLLDIACGTGRHLECFRDDYEIEGRVAIGLLDDGETPCLKIMVEKMTPELEKGLPKTLDGHPVVVEESGVIRPLENP